MPLSGLEGDFRCLPLLLSPQVFETRSPTEAGAHHLARLAGHQDPEILLSPCPPLCPSAGVTEMLALSGFM